MDGNKYLCEHVVQTSWSTSTCMLCFVFTATCNDRSTFERIDFKPSGVVYRSIKGNTHGVTRLHMFSRLPETIVFFRTAMPFYKTTVPFYKTPTSFYKTTHANLYRQHVILEKSWLTHAHGESYLDLTNLTSNHLYIIIMILNKSYVMSLSRNKHWERKLRCLSKDVWAKMFEQGLEQRCLSTCIDRSIHVDQTNSCLRSHFDSSDTSLTKWRSIIDL